MSSQPLTRPDLAAHSHAVRVAFAGAASELRELLGARLVAYLGSVQETRAVHQWAEGTRQPSDQTQRRLRYALQIAQTLAATDGPKVTQAWFQGINPSLDDRSPARLLREGALDEIGPRVADAARAFLAHA